MKHIKENEVHETQASPIRKEKIKLDEEMGMSRNQNQKYGT